MDCLKPPLSCARVRTEMASTEQRPEQRVTAETFACSLSRAFDDIALRSLLKEPPLEEQATQSATRNTSWVLHRCVSDCAVLSQGPGGGTSCGISESATVAHKQRHTGTRVWFLKGHGTAAVLSRRDEVKPDSWGPVSPFARGSSGPPVSLEHAHRQSVESFNGKCMFLCVWKAEAIRRGAGPLLRAAELYPAGAEECRPQMFAGKRGCVRAEGVTAAPRLLGGAVRWRAVALESGSPLSEPRPRSVQRGNGENKEPDLKLLSALTKLDHLARTELAGILAGGLDRDRPALTRDGRTDALRGVVGPGRGTDAHRGPTGARPKIYLGCKGPGHAGSGRNGVDALRAERRSIERNSFMAPRWPKIIFFHGDIKH
ncbi:hypothetical protein SKAU_G00364480 [Synaphobranchus kaupii]|uniref:Uncharacterized protein n=1 Tax=Synaphobranchus kaupii TaxID=118154 RepID=A0A9Q1EET6_SYNKA|nr:hypothetical protein SKAU_G00364480 [Synaphobranchus kaupii]